MDGKRSWISEREGRPVSNFNANELTLTNLKTHLISVGNFEILLFSITLITLQ